MLVLREDWVVTGILNYEEIVQFISNQKKDVSIQQESNNQQEESGY
jgi:hypothetical protein